MARRTRARRRSTGWASGLTLGVLLGAGLVIGVLWAMHARPPVPGPAAISVHPRPAAPRPAPAPRRPASPPPIPGRNPEASEGPAIGPGPTPGVQPAAPQRPPRARVAIIFDDAGYSLAAARQVMALGRPVTMSVLPHLPYSEQIAEEAPAHGVQIILHLPVQPENPAVPLGPGVVTVNMNDGTIEQTVAGDLATVPTAVGANNHEGSLGTSDPRVMRAVISVIKARHLFFVDSLTSPRSVAARVARSMGVPTAVRTVFLDNEDSDAYVRAQLHLVMRIALERGQAIAIGHVGKVTATVLRSMFPEFDEAGIQFVTVSQLVQ